MVDKQVLGIGSFVLYEGGREKKEGGKVRGGWAGLSILFKKFSENISVIRTPQSQNTSTTTTTTTPTALLIWIYFHRAASSSFELDSVEYLTCTSSSLDVRADLHRTTFEGILRTVLTEYKTVVYHKKYHQRTTIVRIA